MRNLSELISRSIQDVCHDDTCWVAWSSLSSVSDDRRQSQLCYYLYLTGLRERIYWLYILALLLRKITAFRVIKWDHRLRFSSARP